MQSAIMPMPDPALGERACCFVTLCALAFSDVTLEELIGFSPDAASPS